MISIKGLEFTYPGDTSPILKDIDLEIEKGDFVGIIGNNGCGKSTLCKTLNGLIPNFIVGNIKGEVIVNGNNIRTTDIGKMALSVGYVYQDFENQIVCPRVIDDASFSSMNFGFEDYEKRGYDALNICGLSNKINDYIWEMSGGQKHLLALASTKALEPEVLILDEPIAQLDPVHAALIYEVLKELNEVHKKTIIVIEHHTDYIAKYCKNVVFMKDGRVEWKKDAKEALRMVDILEESNIFPPQVTVAGNILMKKIKGMKKNILPVTLEEGNIIYKDLKRKVKTNQINTRYGNLEDLSKISEKPLIKFSDVNVSYKAVKGKDASVIKSLNLDIFEGEKIALIGSNGAGKTTLMKLIMKLVKPVAGNIIIKDKPISKLDSEEITKLVSLVYQNPEEMFIKDSIIRDIEFAMKSRNVKDYDKRTEELLEVFNLENIKNKDGRLLSGGQMRRASLAIGIALEPEILLLDEPTANLDIATRKEITSTLNKIKDKTKTVIIATHDMQLVCEWADRIIVLYNGNVVADGNKEEIFNNEYIVNLVGVKPPEIAQMSQMLSFEKLTFTINDFVEEFEADIL